MPFLGNCDLVEIDLWPRFYNYLSGAYLLHYKGRNHKLDVWMHLGMAECYIIFLGQCDLDL